MATATIIALAALKVAAWLIPALAAATALAIHLNRQEPRP